MNSQNRGALFKFWQWDNDLAIKTTWTQQRWVQNIGAVGGRQNDDPFRCLKAVHLREQLVQSLLALVMTATESSTAFATDGINFVNKDNGFTHFASLLEKITNTTCSDTHEHFHEVRTSHRQKSNASFSCDGTGEESFSSSRRAD